MLYVICPQRYNKVTKMTKNHEFVRNKYYTDLITGIPVSGGAAWETIVVTTKKYKRENMEIPDNLHEKLLDLIDSRKRKRVPGFRLFTTKDLLKINPDYDDAFGNKDAIIRKYGTAEMKRKLKVKKSATKKVATKKVATKKSATKKSATKKPATKKTVRKSTATKSTATKRVNPKARQTTKRYTERKSPPYKASAYPNKRKMGNDKKYYISKKNSAGVYRWTKVCKKN